MQKRKKAILICKKNLYKNGKTLTFCYIHVSQSTDMCNMFTHTHTHTYIYIYIFVLLY